MADNITIISLEDPTNPQNILSKDLSIEEKKRIRRLATQAINVTSWNNVFFN